MGFIHAPPLKSSMAGCSISEYSEQSLITILYAKLLFKDVYILMALSHLCRLDNKF